MGGGEPSVYPTVAAAPNVNFGAGVSATQVAAGATHTCALLATGGVRCWGSGTFGQLGIAAAPTFIAVGTGADVNLGEGVTATHIASGYSHSCPILSTGALRCWGLNDKGQLGYGHTDTSATTRARSRTCRPRPRSLEAESGQAICGSRSRCLSRVIG